MLFFIDGASKAGDHVCCKGGRGLNSFSGGILLRLFFSKAGFARVESEARVVFDAISDVFGGTGTCAGRGELGSDGNPPDCCLPAGISPYCGFVVGSGTCGVEKPPSG